MPPPSPLALGVLILVFLPQAVRLSAIDAREHRLPNRSVALLSASTLLLLAACSVIDSVLASLLPFSIVAAALIGIAGIGIALLSPALLGMGDAKTAPVVVLMASVLGPQVLIAALVGMAFLGGILGAITWAITRRGDARFAFGPILLSAPFLGLLGGPFIAGALSAGP